MSPSGSPEVLGPPYDLPSSRRGRHLGTPAVNFDRMYQAMVHDAKAGEGSNKIVYWSRLFDLAVPIGISRMTAHSSMERSCW